MKKLWKFQKGDWNGFWALFADNLANMVILSGVLMFVFKMPPTIIWERILPGLGISLLFGLSIYVYLAYRLSQKENREDVTALPYGISTPIMFVYLFAVMGPVYFKTGNSLLAYQIGLAAALVGGVIEISGSLVGPLLKKLTPRAGMLGTLAGIAIVWIAAIPMAMIFEHPLIGLAPLFIILIGLVGGYRLPFGLPAGLVAILIGVALGFITGETVISPEATKSLGFYMPTLVFNDLWAGLQALWERQELFGIIIPISIYNFIETMNNVESAQAAGDTYPTATCQIVDGLGTCVGALFGSPFPTTVYIGHPAYKKLGARKAYAWMVGLVFCIGALSGVIFFLRALIPEAAVAPLLVFVGIIITQQAFESVPKGHGVACACALIPHIGDLLYKQITLSLNVACVSISEKLTTLLAKTQGVHLSGYQVLSQGAIITGLLWGGLVAFLVDKKTKEALFFSAITFVFCLVGLIHQPGLGFYWTPITWSYLILVGLLLCLAWAERNEAKAHTP